MPGENDTPQPPIEPEYSRFHDNFTEQLPLSELRIREEAKPDLISGDLDPDVWGITVFNEEFEAPPHVQPELAGEYAIKGRFIVEALKLQRWVDIPVPTETYTAPTTMQQFDFLGGIDRLTEHGFITKVATPDGKPMLRPTQQLMDFYKDRLTPRPPSPTQGN